MLSLCWENSQRDGLLRDFICYVDCALRNCVLLYGIIVINTVAMFNGSACFAALRKLSNDYSLNREGATFPWASISECRARVRKRY